MSEKRRQYLGNLALRSPNANERETARQQFLALDGRGKPLLPDWGGPAELSENAHGQELQQRKSALTDEPTKKPTLRAITFATWAVLSASVWGWGPLATLLSACLVMAVAASLFER